MFKNCKELNEQKIHDLIMELEELSKNYNALEKSMKSKVLEKDQLIEDLEKTI